MTPRAILVTGGQGQVGIELARLDWSDSISLLAPDRYELDIADRGSVERFMEANSIATIINCAAYTAVDRAEDEIEAAYAVNAFGAGWLARAARRADIPLVHVSTDYVFGGEAGEHRSEDDPVAPTSVYGASKLAGEIAVRAATDRAVILRTAWVVSAHRSNFLKTMLSLASRQQQIRVVGDQRGCPTTAEDIALALQSIALRMLSDSGAPTGIFHFVNSGEASWAELAAAVMDEAQANGLPFAEIVPIPSAEYPTKVTRPADSRLSGERLTQNYGIEARPWRTAIAGIVRELAGESQRQGTK